MKLQWDLPFLNTITQYDAAQTSVIKGFLQKLDQNMSQQYKFYHFYWSDHILFSVGNAYAVFEDKHYELINPVETQSSALQPEQYVPLLHNGKMILAVYGKSSFLGYLLKNELAQWQTVFLTTQKRRCTVPIDK